MAPGDGIWAALGETGTLPAFQRIGLVQVEDGRVTWTRRRSPRTGIPFRRSRVEIEITNSTEIERVTVLLTDKRTPRAMAVRVMIGPKAYTFRAGHGGNLVQNREVTQRLGSNAELPAHLAVAAHRERSEDRAEDDDPADRQQHRVVRREARGRVRVGVAPEVPQ